MPKGDGTNPNVRKSSPAKRSEWNQWTPEIIEAVRKGWLDDQLWQLVYEMNTRQSLVQRFGYYIVPRRKPVKRSLKRK